MTNIFSSKATVALAEAKATNDKLQATVVDMTAKLASAKTISDDFNAFKEAAKTDKATIETAMETMKNEFSAVINTLKDEVKALTEAKAKVEVEAKLEVAKTKEEVKEKVMEQVATKVAAIGLTEDTLPKQTISQDPYAGIRVKVHRNNISE